MQLKIRVLILEVGIVVLFLAVAIQFLMLRAQPKIALLNTEHIIQTQARQLGAKAQSPDVTKRQMQDFVRRIEAQIHKLPANTILLKSQQVIKPGPAVDHTKAIQYEVSR